MGGRRMRRQRVDDRWKLVFEATLESINRTRRTLVVLIGLICVSLFHLYMWYASWDLARIAARRSLLVRIEEMNSRESYMFGSQASDLYRSEQLRREIGEIEKARVEARFQPPLLGFEVGVNDFTVASQMVALATLLWLVFNQKRLNFCLRKLESVGGWEIPKSLIELNFGLIGSHSDYFMKVVSRFIPLALPVASVLFIASDLYDLSRIQASAWQRLAFEDPEYRFRVFLRLGTDTVLSLGVIALGFWSFSEWVRTEEELTKFAQSQDDLEVSIAEES